MHPIHSDKKVIFLPHYGEWGWFILSYIRLVHHYDAAEKIVCCQAGQQVYFPSATGFYFDWTNPIPDHARKGFRDFNNDAKRELIARLKAEVTGYGIIDQTKVAFEPRPPFQLTPSRLRGLRPDVVIAARQRDRRSSRNWPHWQLIIDRLVECGHTVGLVGTCSGSAQLSNLSIRSYDYSDSDAAIEMLQNCRLFVGTNSGNTHLAAFLNIPIIQFDQDKKQSHWIQSMKEATKGYFFRLGYDAWTHPDVVVAAITSHLERRKTS